MRRISTFLSMQTTHSADWNVSIGGAEGTPSALGSVGAVGARSSISVGGALGDPIEPFAWYSSELAMIFFLIYSLETPS